MTGRPTDYDPKYIDEIIEYFSVEPYFETTKKVASQGKSVEVDVVEASDFPSFAGFAAKIGIHRETLRNWCDKNPDFFAAYKKAKELQENWMLQNGLKGHISTPFGIFVSKNVLGYRDKQPDEEVEEAFTKIKSEEHARELIEKARKDKK